MPLDQTRSHRPQDLSTSPTRTSIVVFLTRDKGVLRGVAKGARKFANRFGSSLEPMSVVRAFYYEKERKDLVTVSNCDLLESFFDVQKDLKVSFTLSYFAELIEEFSPVRSGDDVLFRLLLSILRCLAAGGDVGGPRRLLRGLVPPHQRPPAGPRALQEMPEASYRRGLARPEAGRGLLRGVRPARRRMPSPRDRPVPGMGPAQSAAGSLPARPGGREPGTASVRSSRR